MTKNRRFIYQINQARHAMMKAMDAGCREQLGISATQLTVLMVLRERNDCLMKELAAALMLDSSAITGLARRMQENDLIRKTPCSEDSRASRLSLTDKGSRLLKQGLPLLREVSAAMDHGFSEDELDTVARYLTHVTSMFS